MIEIIRIKNIALIEEVEVSFSQGLNILSGETGAGKSIIIGSISFLLGNKTPIDFIRTDKDAAEVEGLFSIKNDFVKNAISSLGVEIGDDDLFVVHRILNRNGKSMCRINGKPVSLTMLKEISNLLIDLHGQHSHQSLLSQSKHIELLDRFIIDETEELKKNLSNVYREYKQVTKSLEELIADERELSGLIDLYSFQLEEINSSELYTGEEEELNEKKKILSNSEKLSANANEISELLYSGENSSTDKISKALVLLSEIEKLDSSKKHLYDSLYNIETELSEIARELRKYQENLYYDPDELNIVEDRLSLIYNLKRKYGDNISEILSYRDEIEKKLNLITNRNDELKKLEDKKNHLHNQGIEISSEISNIRKNQAKILENGIIENLFELGMEDAKFKIDISQKENFGIDGFDRVEFLISANKGEPLKQLSKIASGGEMSRIMLALKIILAKADNIDTFIFDEIDTGVSGRTAQKVAEKLKILSTERQIICITHLPQIASMADRHFLIEKESGEDKTITKLFRLDTEESIKEIARLIGGAQITDKTLKAAEEMISLAKN